jgi:hypothetical protein
MKLVITTQYMENYGDATNPYWKYKGGLDYAVLNVDARGAELDDLVAKAKAKVEYANDYSEEYVIGWTLMGDNDLTPSERDQLEYGGEIIYRSEVISLDEDYRDDYSDSMDGDEASALASAGWGTDEDYGGSPDYDW